MKTTRKTLVERIVEKTAVKTSEAKEALEALLGAIKRALKTGRKVDIGIGLMSVLSRPLSHRINKNLKQGINLDRIHKKHPRTVTLTKRPDLSENPLPTIVSEPERAGSRMVHVAVALPAWRHRIKKKGE